MEIVPAVELALPTSRVMLPELPAELPVEIATLPELPLVVVVPVWMVMESEAVAVRLAVLRLEAVKAYGTADSFIRLPELVISVSQVGEVPVSPTLMVM